MILSYTHKDHMEWAMQKWKSLSLAAEFCGLYKAYKVPEHIYKQLMYHFRKQILRNSDMKEERTL